MDQESEMGYPGVRRDCQKSCDTGDGEGEKRGGGGHCQQEPGKAQGGGGAVRIPQGI